MATSVAQEKLLTAEEFYALPDDGPAYELVEGRLEAKFEDDDGTPMTGASARHGRISARLLVAVATHVESRGLGPVFDGQTTFLLRGSPDTVRAPDVSFVSWDRLPGGVIPPGRLSLAPELAAEVLSPNDRATRVQRKIREYLDAGVRLVWIADPENRIVTAYTVERAARIHGESDTLDGGEVLPELRIPVAPLFAFERPAPDA